MKNVNDRQIKKCIFKELNEFKQDVAAFFGNDTTVECYDDGIVIEANEEALYTEEILAGIKSIQAIVDRIEDNNIAVVELSYNDEIKLIDVAQEDFVNPKREGEKIDISAIKGRFYTRFNEMNEDKKQQTFYEFRSNDGSIRWILSTEQIARIDNDNSKYSFEELERVENIPDYESEYTLIYYDNGTNENNKPCLMMVTHKVFYNKI